MNKNDSYNEHEKYLIDMGKHLIKIMKENYMNENEKQLRELGNEVVRIRQEISRQLNTIPCNTLSIMATVSNILELFNEFRIILYSKKETIKPHQCEKIENDMRLCCFTTVLTESLVCSLQKKEEEENVFSIVFNVNFCPICGCNANNKNA